MANLQDEKPAPAFGSCPLPASRYDHILLGHGSGGQLTADLIGRLFVPGFGKFNKGAITSRDWVTFPILRIIDMPKIKTVVINNPTAGPIVDSPDRQMAHTWAFSAGVKREIAKDMAEDFT